MRPRDTQSLPTSWALGNLFTSLHVHFFMRVLRQSNTYTDTHLCHIHMYMPYWEQGAVLLKAGSGNSPTAFCYLYTNTHNQKTCLYPTEKAKSYHGSGFPRDLPSLNIKPFHPQSLLCTTKINIYIISSNGPSRTCCKWAIHAECHLFSALVLKNSCLHMLTELHDSLFLAEKVLLQINSGSFRQFCIRFGNSPLTVIEYGANILSDYQTDSRFQHGANWL